MSETDLRKASLAAIERSGQVLAEVRQEQERIREALRESRELDERRTKRSVFGLKLPR